MVYLQKSDPIVPNLSTPDEIINYLQEIDRNECWLLYKSYTTTEYDLNYFSTIINKNCVVKKDWQRQIPTPASLSYGISLPEVYPCTETPIKEYPWFIKRNFYSKGCNFAESQPIFNPLIYWEKERIFEEGKQYGYIFEDGKVDTLTFIDSGNHGFVKKESFKKFLLENDYQLTIYFSLRLKSLETKNKIRTWEHGTRDFEPYIYTCFIKPEPPYTNSFPYLLDGKMTIKPGEEIPDYPRFITCNGKKENINKTLSNSISILSFKSSVLEKYQKYQFNNVEPRRLTCPGFSLILMNNNYKNVSTLTYYMSQIPLVEQIHWSLHNIAPLNMNEFDIKEYEVHSKGIPHDPQEPGYKFRELYNTVSSLWLKKYGFSFLTRKMKGIKQKKILIR